MSRNTLVLIGSNTTGSGRELAALALRRGHRVVLLSNEDDDFGLRGLDGLRVIQTELDDFDALVTEVERTDSESPVCAIWSTSEFRIHAAARLARLKALPGLDPEVIARARDKAEQRRSLRAAGVPSPRSVAVSTAGEAIEAAGRIGLPVCIKPTSASGSVGVRIVHEMEGIGDAAEVALSAGVPGAALVEEYVSGPEFSVEVFNGRPIAVVRKYLGGLHGVLEIAHVTPAPIAGALDERLRQTASDATDALGLGRGPVHVELRVRKDNAFIIEVNPRLAGGMIPELVRLSSGVDLIAASLDLATGREQRLVAKPGPFAAIAFAVAPTPGEVQEIPPVVEFDGCRRIGQLRQSGSHIVPRGDYRDRFAYAIATNRRSNLALSIARRAADLLEQRAFLPEPTTGLLRRSLRPHLRGFLFGTEISSDHLEDLHYYAAIEKALVVMQLERELLRPSDGARVLRAIHQLEQTGFEALRGRALHRGLYLSYEAALTDLVGPEGARAIHVARSRNDIGATLHRLKLRVRAEGVMDKGVALVRALLERHHRDGDAIMPLYTQHLPAMPGRLGHYMLGVASSLTRELQGYHVAMSRLEECPLGAGAGGGTDLPIDAGRTAQLLGFTGAVANSIDAVASRDAATALSAAGALLAVVLSRLAADLQSWSRAEIAMISFPDDLVGSSSVLPQKRNHFLLEHVQSRAATSLGQFITGCAAQQATPFSNSVAVGTESVRTVTRSMIDLGETLEIAYACIDGFVIDRVRMASLAGVDQNLAPALAEQLRRHSSMSFRDAHHLVGEALRSDEAGSLGERVGRLARERGLDISLDMEVCAARLADVAEYGGGPGLRSLRHQAAQIRSGLMDLERNMASRRDRYETAMAKLQERVREFSRPSAFVALQPREEA